MLFWEVYLLMFWGVLAYTMSKAAVDQLTRSISIKISFNAFIALNCYLCISMELKFSILNTQSCRNPRMWWKDKIFSQDLSANFQIVSSNSCTRSTLSHVMQICMRIVCKYYMLLELAIPSFRGFCRTGRGCDKRVNHKIKKTKYSFLFYFDVAAKRGGGRGKALE